MEFTEELKKILAFLVGDIRKILSPKCCTVIVMDDDLRTSILIGDNTTISQDLIEEIRAHALHSERDAMDIDAIDASCIEKFSGQHYNVYVPVLLKNELAGILLVGFHQSLTRNDSDYARQMLYGFAREMAVAIETSRLVGNSALLQESHHRIKNNLQIIVNLLFMQKMALCQHGPAVTDAIDKVINQVKSIALIHDLLSNGRLGKNVINLKVIIQEIVCFFKSSRIEFELCLENISIPYNKASTIALIINELITNCVKHAFPNQQDKRVSITCSSRDGNLCLVVKDNGVGFPVDKSAQKHGIGSTIINTAVLKMGGSVCEKNLTENGCAQTEIHFNRSGVYE